MQKNRNTAGSWSCKILLKEVPPRYVYNLEAFQPAITENLQ